MRGFSGRIVRYLACAVAALGMFACSSSDGRNEVVATANGDKIDVREVREFLGIRGGLIAAKETPVKRKEEAVDRLVAGRLLAQEARARGFASSKEFADSLAKSEQIVMITALFRKELEAVKVPEKDVKAEAGNVRKANASLSEKDAEAQARALVVDKRIRKLEEDLVAKARKESSANVDRAVIQRIGAGEDVPADAIVATVGSETIRYGDVAAIIASMSGAGHEGGDLAKNPIAVEKAVEREVTGRLLAAYARKKGLDGSAHAKAARADMERALLIDMYAGQVVKDVAVTDKDIRAAYAEHEKMFVREGKKVPLGDVKAQIREFLENDRKRKALEANIEELKKKAKITINAAAMSKV